ncbi:MAG: decaprenyl-phosphate phosphoribosyltransferase [Bacilli bacterium]
MIVLLLIKQLRPVQWTKNLLVFAAFIFHIPFITFSMFAKEIACFALFSLTAGCVYIFNDFIDLDLDRDDPNKRKRPMASGLLPPQTALWFGAALLACTLACAFFVTPVLASILTAYVAVNILYSLQLKNMAIIDIFAISSGFVLRALAGGAAIGVPFTAWFLFCAMLLSLFLATGKRRFEMMQAIGHDRLHRRVLADYTPALLDQLASVTAGLTIMSYSMFTFTSHHTRCLMFTIPLVIYGMFRYFLLIHVDGQGGNPELHLFQDRHILIVVALFGAAVVGLLWTLG